MTETTPPLVTDEDLDCLDTLTADGTMQVSGLYVLAPRQRARWVADALDNVAGTAVPLWDEATKQVVHAVPTTSLHALAAQYRAGQR